MKNTNWKPLALVGVLSSGLTLGGAHLLGLDSRHDVILTEASSSGSNVKFTASPTALPGDFVGAADKSTPAVVHIKSKIVRNVRQQRLPSIFDFFGGDEDFFGGRQAPQQRQQGEASGSGVVISPDGYIVTNNHVVADASELEVVLSDRRKFKAKVVGADPNTDIAVIQIEGSKVPDNLPYLPFANSDDIKVGEWVLAVGNPFNLESTVTAGIVSAKGRSIGIIGDNDKAQSPIEAFIQTDAAVNPGNSGGALVNLKGELIGINTAIAGGATGTYVGYSFAVPSNLVKKVAGDLLKYGNVQRGYLGVSKMEEVDEKLANERDLKTNTGVYFGTFGENPNASAAKAAGLKIGDVIVKVDGRDVTGIQKLVELVGQHKPGDVIVVTVNRDGQLKDFNVTLKNMEGSTTITKSPVSSLVQIESIGAKLDNVNSNEKAKFHINGGAKVVEVLPDGWMEYQEVPVGFIITKIDDTAVKDAKQVGDLLANRKGRVRIIGIDPSNGQQYRIDGTLR
ncbi:MAG: trypsin-like peptidase domain-containing protein [Siphonobacter sp.]